MQQWELRFWAPFRRLPKALNSSEDVHTKGMSTFEVDEHLREEVNAYFFL
jgi:hypothetical protein